MSHYLISFPSSALDWVRDEQLWAEIERTSREVIREAKAAGVYVFGGGLDDTVAPVRIAADGAVSTDLYRETRLLDGGFCVLDLPTREAAEEWAAKLAAGCHCDQELRPFHDDPES
ncbi:transcription initiation protein [Leucobacter sp. UCD-THU]|uniref:Transcription initiation protein n=1 Tax=Leucobacter muris TaxID=1935379 RepID=A0ABX5QDE7_9MICO|nr:MULTISPECIES: hypothetical protein [Leucobacter]EYT56554.1 transcription initiation protein [Leucobacter sp. UCD-THU]QAB17080.1 transcription initiation protein [Leucobacter muris]